MAQRSCESRRTFLARLVFSALLLLVVSPSSARALPPDKPRGEAGVYAIGATIENAFLKAIADDDGTFVIGTTGGDPGTPDDDNKRLLYGYPDYPGTSFTTVRIVSGGSTSDYALSGVQPSQQPAVVGEQIVAVWSVQNVEIRQVLSMEHNPYTGRDDTVRVEYVLTNVGEAALDAGLRVMLDVMIGSNDGAPYLIPGEGNQTTEVEYLGSDVPAFWQAFESETFDPSSLKGMGILRTGGEMPPDRFVIAYWYDIVLTSWDYPVTPGLGVTGDSATAMYWDPTTLAPGASRTLATYYGLPGAGGGDAWFVAPAALTCNDLSFGAVLRVSNTATSTFTGGNATLSLPQGLVLAAGETTSKPLADIPPGETASTTWSIEADGSATGTLGYSAVITFTAGSDPLAAAGTIEVPDCDATPTSSPTATLTSTPSSPTSTPTATNTIAAPTATYTPSAPVTPWAALSFPLVFKDYCWAASHASTPTSTSVPCEELVRNGGFEYDGDWTFGTTPHTGVYTTAQFLSGARSARLGVAPPDADVHSHSPVYQTVTIPGDALTVQLSFWYKPFAEGTTWSGAGEVTWEGYDPAKVIQHGCDAVEPSASDAALWSSYDFQECLVLNSQYGLLDAVMKLNSNTQTWTQVAYDLSAYRGQTIVLYFNACNNGWGNERTWMHVDDVQVIACRSAVPTPTPSITPWPVASPTLPHPYPYPSPYPYPYSGQSHAGKTPWDRLWAAVQRLIAR